MKLSFSQGLVVIGIVIPLSLFAVNMGTWAFGVLLGECFGLISFVWIALTVRRILVNPQQKANQALMLHSLGRYLMMGTVLFLAIKWPAVNVWGVVIGYSIIQLPAAIIRALETKP